MSKNTKIQWCDSTVNFWSGCTKVSPGCAHCYAETRDKRHMIEPVSHWGKGATRLKHVGAVATALRLNKKPWICDSCGEASAASKNGSDPFCNHCNSPEPSFHCRRIFANSLSDWLDAEVPIEWLAEMLDTIRQCPEVIWILCTKRPENFFPRIISVIHYIMAHLMASGEGIMPEIFATNPNFKPFADEVIRKPLDELKKKFAQYQQLVEWLGKWCPHPGFSLPDYEYAAPKNIILLTSVENQDTANARIRLLLKIPAVCHGLSMEPLLGPVDLNRIALDKNTDSYFDCLTGLHCYNGRVIGPRVAWLIIGGESGRGARQCEMEWVQSLVEQGQKANVPTFVKQLGALVLTEEPHEDKWPAGTEFDHNCISRVLLKDPKGGNPAEWPKEIRIQQWPQL